jgi:hypothetical protein
VAASGLRLDGEQKCMRQVRTRLGLDTCRHQTPPGSCSRPGYVLSWDLGAPLRVARTPYGEVRIPFQWSGLHTWRSQINLGGPDCISRGPTLSHGGPDLLLMPWSISPSLDTWRLRTRPCGGVGRCRGLRVVARDWGEPWPGPTHTTPLPCD